MQKESDVRVALNEIVYTVAAKINANKMLPDNRNSNYVHVETEYELHCKIHGNEVNVGGYLDYCTLIGRVCLFSTGYMIY